MVLYIPSIYLEENKTRILEGAKGDGCMDIILELVGGGANLFVTIS